MPFIDPFDPRSDPTFPGFDSREFTLRPGSAGAFTMSGYIPINYNKTHTLVWYDYLVTATGVGSIRIHYYDDSYESLSYNEYAMSTGVAMTGWQRNIRILRGYNQETTVGEYNIPSGAAYIKLSLEVPDVSGTVTERYIGGLDLNQGTHYVGYTTISGDSTFVSLSGMDNGYFGMSNPLLRTDYIFLGDRKWKSEDAATNSGGYLTYTDNTAVNQVEYTYVIDAYDINGNRSPLSSPQTIRAGDIYPPSQVSGLAAVGAPEAVVLTWVSPADEDFSHVNIYSDVALSTLIKPEYGKPSHNDSVVIGNLTAGVTYNFYVTAVDKYGNENIISVPTVFGVPTEFDESQPIDIIIDGDQWYTTGTYVYRVFSEYDIPTMPTVTGFDLAGTPLVMSNLGVVSATGVYVWSGSFTVSSSHAEGQAYLVASGIGSGGETLVSQFELFNIDKTVPSFLSISRRSYSFFDGTKYFYTGPARFQVSLYDSASGPKEYMTRVGSLSGDSGQGKIWHPYALNDDNIVEVDLVTEGLNTVYFKGRDIAGNESAESNLAVYRDTLPPIVSISGIAGSSTSSGWYNSDSLQVKFKAVDDTTLTSNVAGISGVYYRYSYNGAPTGSWAFAALDNPTITVPTTGTLPVSTETVYIEYYGVDNAKNQSEPNTTIINIDTQSPYFSGVLWQNSYGVAGGFNLFWNPSSIKDDEPSSGIKDITIYRSTTNAFAGEEQWVATIPFNSGVRSYVDTSSELQYGKPYWWAMKVSDNAGNLSIMSTSISGQIDHDIRGIFRNFVGNGSFERVKNGYPDDWAYSGSPTIDVSNNAAHGANFANCNLNNYYYKENIPLVFDQTNVRWLLSFYAKYTSGSPQARIVVEEYGIDNELIATTTINKTLTTSWGRYTISIGNGGDFDFDTATLSFKMLLKSSSGTYYVLYDGIQLEQPVVNTSTTPTDYVDSFVITGDIIQGQRIIGSQIEAETITAQNLKIKYHGGNLIRNSSFEIYDLSNNIPTDWNGFSVAVSNLYAFDGDVCLPITPTTVLYQSFFTVQESQNYTLSFYAYNPGTTVNLTCSIFCINKAQGLQGNIIIPLTISGNSAFERVSVTFGNLATGYLWPSAAYDIETIAIGLSDSTGTVYTDAFQLERGIYASSYANGGFTEIAGGVIKTGKIIGNDVDGYTEFNLNSGRITTYSGTDTTIIRRGEIYTAKGNQYTQMGAGSLLNKNTTDNSYSQLSTGQLKNYDGATGNYSTLSAGALLFYNALAGTITNYAHQIQYLYPYEINCGSVVNFPIPYANGTLDPYVVLIPNKMQTYESSSAVDQYIGLEVDNISATSFTPHAYIYLGGGATTNTTIAQGSIDDSVLDRGGSDNDTYESAWDGLDQNCPSGNINKITIVLRGRNVSTVSPKTALFCKVRVRHAPTDTGFSSATPDAGLTTSKSILTLPYGDDWVYATVTINASYSDWKYIKVDWVSGGDSATQEVEIYEVTYTDEPTKTELTGYDICGALIIGRTGGI